MNVALAAMSLAMCGGCGDDSASDESASSPDESALRRAADDFAFAVSSGDIAFLCEHLAGEARRQQGCGTDAADLGPFLRLGIRKAGDIRFVRVDRSTAIARFPDFRAPADASRAPTLIFERIGDEWKVTEIRAG